MHQDYYAKNAQSYFENTVNNNLSDLHDTFLSYLDKGSHVLDAGCGSGRDSKVFSERGYVVDSFDASPELAEIAAEHTGLKIKVMTFSQLDEREKYDGIWCCASLLHVPENNLKNTFELLEKALRQDGILYASFKHGQGERVRKGRRFTDMNKEGIREIVSEIPVFTILKTWKTEDARSERDEQWFNILIKKMS